MPSKMSISVTDAQVQDIQEAVASGEYASASEVVRDAMRTWRINRRLGQLWDEGIASGVMKPGTTMAGIKAEARRRKAAGK
jgi:antitoxin ParD1/3/4